MQLSLLPFSQLSSLLQWLSLWLSLWFSLQLFSLRSRLSPFSLRLLPSLSSLRGRSPSSVPALRLFLSSLHVPVQFPFSERMLLPSLFSPPLQQLFPSLPLPLPLSLSLRLLPLPFLSSPLQLRLSLFSPQQTEPFSLPLKQISLPLSWLMFSFSEPYISSSFSAFSATSSGL